MNISILLRVVVVAAGAAVLCGGPAWARGGNPGQEALSSPQPGSQGQATQLLQRLGYGTALAGGGQSGQTKPDLSDSAAQVQQQLRTGMSLKSTLPATSPQAGVLADLPQNRAAIQPHGLSSKNPAIAGLDTIPGQDSPYTSSGNAAGYRPYRLPPGVKGP